MASTPPIKAVSRKIPTKVGDSHHGPHGGQQFDVSGAGHVKHVHHQIQSEGQAKPLAASHKPSTRRRVGDQRVQYEAEHQGTDGQPIGDAARAQIRNRSHQHG